MNAPLQSGMGSIGEKIGIQMLLQNGGESDIQSMMKSWFGKALRWMRLGLLQRALQQSNKEFQLKVKKKKKADLFFFFEITNYRFLFFLIRENSKQLLYLSTAGPLGT